MNAVRLTLFVNFSWHINAPSGLVSIFIDGKHFLMSIGLSRHHWWNGKYQGLLLNWMESTNVGSTNTTWWQNIRMDGSKEMKMIIKMSRIKNWRFFLNSFSSPMMLFLAVFVFTLRQIYYNMSCIRSDGYFFFSSECLLNLKI